ncbi:MAG: ATP-binding protein [Nitrospirota bacterium]
MFIFFGLLTFLILQREKNIIYSFYNEKSLQTADTIAETLLFTMLEEDPRETIDHLRLFNQREGIRVGVIGPNGLPAFDTDLPVPAEIFSARKETHIKAGSELFFYKPLKNDFRCSRCHNPENSTRGMIVVRTSMEKAETEIRETAKRLLFFAFFLGLTSEIFLLVVMRKTVLEPIEKLAEGAEILKAGKLDHRIEIKRGDEIGALVSCFNEMADSIEKSRINLEKTVMQRTKELRIIAELSTELFRGDIRLRDITDQFLDTITDEMGFAYSALYLIDRETGLLSQNYRKGIDDDSFFSGISLAGEHPLVKTIIDTRPVIRKYPDIGAPAIYGNMAIIPILSRQRKRCSEINLCRDKDCPAFESPEERCWLINDTHCRNPLSAAGKEKIYGCLHCPSFHVLGILIAGKHNEISRSSMHSLEIISSEIASAMENHRFIESKKKDIDYLIKLHNISVEALQNLNLSALTESIVSSATIFANMDASILWLIGEDKRLHYMHSYNIEKDPVPKSMHLDELFIGESLIEDRLIESISLQGMGYLGELLSKYGFLYMSIVPLKFKGVIYGCLTLFKKKDFFMTDSEKAIVSLFASQSAAAVNSARLYEDLEEKESSYRTLSENLPGIVYRVFLRENNRMQFFNNAVQVMTGFSQEELKRGEICSIDPLILSEDRGPILDTVRRSITDNKPFQIEYRIVHKDGGIRYFHESGRPVRGTDGYPNYIDGVIFDVTERKRSEDEMIKLYSSLKTEKEFSDAILNNMTMGVMVIDIEGRIIKLNQVGARILNINHTDIKGKKFKDIMPQASDFLLIDNELNRELSISDGKNTIPIGFGNSPLIDINGQQTGTIVVFRDLTEIKKLQEELRKKQHFEAMGKVMAGVAHEIRNPLFGISAIVQILEKEISSEQHLALLNAMLKEIYRLKNLIDELLLYSRPSKLNITRVDLNVLAGNIKLYINAKRDDIIMDLSIRPSVVIKGDQDKLTQVFLNLIDNAIGAGCRKIEISGEKKDSSILITVRDDGTGIKSESAEKVFEPFFTTKKEGTGLGLSICRKIIEDHGGSIEIKSFYGAGASVILTLPSD